MDSNITKKDNEINNVFDNIKELVEIKYIVL